MQYFVSKDLKLDENSLEISQNEYDALLTSYQNLSNAIYIEEKFDIIMENFMEYENDLLTTAWRSIVFIYLYDDELKKARELITRRIINLLSIGLIFEGQCKSHLRKITSLKTQKTAIDKMINDIKANSLGYSFCKELRNYALHQDFPVTIISNKFDREYISAEDSYLCSKIIPMVSTEVCENFSKEEKDTLIKSLSTKYGMKLDLRPLIREFILGIYNILFKSRVLIADETSKNETLIFDTLKKLGITSPSKKMNIYLIQKKELENKFDYITIVVGVMARRKDYIEKNNLPDTFVSLYASNKI